MTDQLEYMRLRVTLKDKQNMKTPRWKFIGENALAGNSKALCVTDTKLKWCSVQVEMHPDGEDPELIAKAIAEFLNERFPAKLEDRDIPAAGFGMEEF
jgi:hypothetical protein